MKALMREKLFQQATEKNVKLKIKLMINFSKPKFFDKMFKTQY